MPLGEAVLYLKHGIKRHFGSDVSVRLVDPLRPEGRGSHWQNERPWPLVVIDGELVAKGTVSVKQIVQEVTERKKRS